MDIIYLGFVDLVGNDLNLLAVNDLINKLRDFVAPFLLAIISFMAIMFLFKRQMMQLVTFLLFGVVVFLIFYAPDWIQNLGQGIGKDSKDDIKW